MEDKLIPAIPEDGVLMIDFYPDTSFLDRDMGQYTKIPLAEITAMGSTAVSIIANFAQSAEGLYHVSFPRGAGEMVRAKGGGYRAMLRGTDKKFTGQGVLKKAGGFNPVDFCSSVTMAAMSYQLSEIKRFQIEMIELFERDKKAQLLADLELLTEFSENYRLYEENDATLLVNLNQVKDIKRNAKKELLSYREEIEDILSGKWTSSFLKGASNKVGRLYEKLARFKLANYVYAFSLLMETIFTKNYQEQYLEQTIDKLRANLNAYRQLYTNCSYEVEKSMKQDIGTLAMSGLAKMQKFTGEFIGKTPLKKTNASSKLLSYSEVTGEKEKERIEKTVEAFAGLRDDELSAFIKNLLQVNTMYNKPCELIWNKEVLYICQGSEAPVNDLQA
jgi:hypothetical protein